MKNLEIKFTTDGRKVVVIGNLNSQEKIVQEIFIVNGNEIPSGENFVVKSLHDAPAISWQEKRLKTLEATYEKDKKYWEDSIKKLNNEKRLAYDSLSSRVKWLRNVAKEPRDKEFKKIINHIADFLSGSEKWVLVRYYSEWHLEKFNEDGCNSLLDRYDGMGCKRFDHMRLLSLFGKSDGSLMFRINDYSDGSGSDRDVVFFKSKEEALKFIQNDLDDIKKYNDCHLKTAEKYNLKLDDEKLSAYNDEKRSSVEKQVKELQNRIDELQNKLK
ncbi:hypothetical protein CMU71_14875 [Elizabethkingia anophelis]|nr:hypothetical protein [Elizabethkingia anophelis]